MNMNDKPYKTLGTKLKSIRLKAKESLQDLCGAVETDELTLKNIEDGIARPSEDLVLLLISHFALKEEEALKLWEMAGYNQSDTGHTSISADQNGIVHQAFITTGDIRIIYTDMVHIKANNHGVVINFLQNLGADDHTMAVSRVGMSHEHAKSLLKVLKQTLDESSKRQKFDKSDKKSK
jgi:transcriptional regulator with XRE-family HTH domain